MKKIIIILLCYMHSVVTYAISDSLLLTPSQAREEVQFVMANMLRNHPNPFHITPKQAFFSEYDSLMNRKGDISIARQYFDLSKLVSMAYDTHTQLHVTKETPGFDSSFPLRFKIFPDGLYIIAGSSAYRKVIGSKVVSICGQNPDDVIDKLANYAFADHILRKKVYAETFLYMPEMYEALGIKNKDGKIELTLEDSDGKQSKLVLNETWAKGYADFSWDRLNPFIPEGLITVHEAFNKEAPFFQKNINDNYWYQFLDDDNKIMYLQINQQSVKDDEPIIDFHYEWIKKLKEAKSKTLIIDLRNDPGGYITMGSAIVKTLQLLTNADPDLCIAVLFGLDTVSAGPILIAQMELSLRPVFIGEPSGSSPNMYLDPAKMVLPYSKFDLEVSRLYYVSQNSSDPREYIAPDVPISLTFKQYLNGEDPLIDYAKTINSKLQNSFYEEVDYRDEWKRSSQKEAIRK